MKNNGKTESAEPKKRVTLAGSVSVEMEEKKSIFIGHATPVKSEDEARAFIDAKKREYHDARHNCYAYLLNGGAVARYSDDSEPQGTAGIPILNVLKMSGATDLCVVVTRYFGGILLGAGGLVRAYSASAKMALDEAGFAVFEDYAVFRIDVSYSDYQKLTVALAKMGAIEDGCDFGEGVAVTTAVVRGREEELKKTVAEVSYGKGKATLMGYEERAAKV